MQSVVVLKALMKLQVDFARSLISCQLLAWNEGMERNMETIVGNYMGTTPPSPTSKQ